MADETTETPNRATVALVSEQVKGLEQLVKSEFRGMQRQLDAVAGLPVAFERLRADHDALAKDVEDLKDESESKGAWRRGPLLTVIVVGALGLAELIVGLIQLAGGATGHA